MRHWKRVITGLLFIFLLFLIPAAVVSSEEGEEEEYQEEEEPIPDSYYYPIESNQIPGWPQGPAIEAASAAVMDIDTGTFLYSKNATAKQYPASTTKIMTALLLVENCNLDDTITFSSIVYDLEEGSSHLGIQPGEEMVLQDAVYGLLLASANDIANGVAEYMAGSLSAFADMMNQRAAELGCVNTHFSNPHGLFSEDHYTCAYDMALIAQAAYKNPMFREIMTTHYYEIPETNLTKETRVFQNHHNMMHSDTEYYRDWCTGGKTGYTEDCLNTLVTFGEKDGKRLVGVVLRVNGAGKAYRETTSIMEYAFDEFTDQQVSQSALSPSFYEIMGLGCLGKAAEFQSPVWKRRASAGCEVAVTLPLTLSLHDLAREVTQGAGVREKDISYSYGGWRLGTAKGTFYPVTGPAQMVFERVSPFLELNQAEAVSGEAGIQIESVDDVVEWVSEIFAACSGMFLDFAGKNLLVVAVAGFVALILVIIFLVVLFFRCTSDYRIQRRRKQEEKERLKREEEIERMTAAEIEQELRAVMEEERKKRELAQKEKAEAEKAAMEAKRMEEELRETEELLAELERERLERLKQG